MVYHGLSRWSMASGSKLVSSLPHGHAGYFSTDEPWKSKHVRNWATGEVVDTRRPLAGLIKRS